jgi:hypothetical protein
LRLKVVVQAEIRVIKEQKTSSLVAVLLVMIILSTLYFRVLKNDCQIFFLTVGLRLEIRGLSLEIRGLSLELRA